MGTAIVTGSGGLVGSESVRHLVEAGWRYDVEAILREIHDANVEGWRAVSA